MASTSIKIGTLAFRGNLSRGRSYRSMAYSSFLICFELKLSTWSSGRKVSMLRGWSWHSHMLAEKVFRMDFVIMGVRPKLALS